LVLNDNVSEGVHHLEKAAKLDPHNLQVQRNLGNAYVKSNRTVEAVRVLFSALAIDPRDVGTHLLLSQALFMRDRYEASEHHARRALELVPGAEQAKLFLAQALAAKGEFEEAIQLYESIIGKTVNGIPALSRLASLRRVLPESPERKIIDDVLEDMDDIGPEGQSYVLFAAGKSYKDMGDYKASFGYFRRANDILSELYPFDEAHESKRTERLMQLLSSSMIERLSNEEILNAAPVFICGLPRSGTTLLQQMLSNHPQMETGGELLAASKALMQNKRIVAALESRLPEGELTVEDLTRLGDSYLSFVRNEGVRAERFTDKMPMNYRLIGLLALAMPRAKFIILRRHPLDCLLSNYFHNFARNQPATSRLDWLASTYNDFDRAAAYWQASFPDRVKEVQYEQIVEETETVLPQICSFLELPWDPAVLDHTTSSTQVGTASLSQVRQPLYRSSIGSWKNYAQFLAPLATGIRAHLSKYETELCRI
jgi:tetratricopeptide (TPR) repeat protein